MEFLKDFLLDDWRKVPKSARFLTILGSLLIANSWLLDHWNPNNQLPFPFLVFDIRAFSYNFGLILIILAVVVIIIQTFRNFETLTTKYKKKYPIEKFEIDFYLLWFRGKLIVFDKKEKKYYHVYPWQTAEDLNFVSYGKHVDDQFPNPKQTIIKLDNGEEIDVRDYKNGGSINTQQ